MKVKIRIRNDRNLNGGMRNKKIRWERDLIIFTGWTRDSLKIDGVMKNGKSHESETWFVTLFLLLRCCTVGAKKISKFTQISFNHSRVRKYAWATCDFVVY